MSDAPDTVRPPHDRARFHRLLADRPLLAVVGGAIGIRLIAAIALARTPVGLHDPLLYQRFAQGIAKGDGYTAFYGTSTAYYPPGYPFFLGMVQWVCDRLSISDQLPLVAALVQALLGGVTVWAVIRIGDRLQPGTGASTRPARRLGIIAGVIVAVWPNLIVHSTVLLSETLYLALFAAFLLVTTIALQSLSAGQATITRNRLATLFATLLGAGTLLGLATLIRPQVLLVFAAIAVTLAVGRFGLARSATMLALPLVAVVIVITPWAIRNADVFGEFIPVSTNGGDNLCVGFHPGVTGHFEIPPYCDTGEFYIDGPDAEARRNTETTDLAIKWATDNLGALPALSVRKLWYTYEHDHDALRAVESYEKDRFLASPLRSLLRWTSDLYFYAVMAATVVGTVLVARRAWPERTTNPALMALLTVTAVSAVVPILFFGETRFKVPATPCFALLAAFAIMRLAGRKETS